MGGVGRNAACGSPPGEVACAMRRVADRSSNAAALEAILLVMILLRRGLSLGARMQRQASLRAEEPPAGPMPQARRFDSVTFPGTPVPARDLQAPPAKV